METLTCIETRRSVRKYKPDPISDGLLKKVLNAVRWAPSWTNSQCWELIIVTDANTKAALRDTLTPTNPARSAMIEAPIVVAFCGRQGRSGFKKGETTTVYGDWFMFDLGIAAENFCLAAHDLGLGTVHVGLFDHKTAGEILKLPNDIKIVEMIPLGYPDHTPPAPPRRNTEDFIHKNRF